MKLYTVSKEVLQSLAASIERDAKASLTSYVLLGQTERYGDEMRRAATLRHAAAQRSIYVRREILRASGFDL